MNCVAFEDCKIKTKSATAKYMLHRTNADFGRESKSNPWFFSRCNHSTDNIIKIEPINTQNVLIVRYQGIQKRLLSAIPQMYSQACPILCALKIIHPNIAKKNVSNIWPVSLHDGRNLPLATWFVYFRFFPVKIKGRNRTA